MRNPKIKKITVCAIMIALSTILSLIKIYELPLGGSVTLLSMLPICMVSFKYGLKWGFFAAFVNSLIQLFLSFGEVMGWGLTPVVLVSCFMLDYILAYTSLGIAGIFRNNNKIGLNAGKTSLHVFNKDLKIDKSSAGICLGILLAMSLRMLCHFISGTVLFAAWAPEGWNVVLYSICYNGAYMLPEAVFTMVATIIISKTSYMKKIVEA